MGTATHDWVMEEGGDGSKLPQNLGKVVTWITI